ncbi:hypothetical protein ACJMK2_008454 [Sinanodonta woodiana]|uniref:C-type lectin domain-containing protein n=1 Tax=Sinanodonta woodiana TaxID=1069815 RepID=A0ABD3VLN1_SINWO
MSYISLVAILGLVFPEISGDCLNGWLHHGHSCYHISRDCITWADAYKVCTIIGEGANGRLVEIEDSDEAYFIEHQVQLMNDIFWIGATDVMNEGKFIWMTSKNTVTTAHWSPGQPDGYNIDENCIQIWSNGKWNDAPCSGQIRYICESDEGTFPAEVVG